MTDDFIREPYVALDSASWTIAFKPHGMPTAPIREGEGGTLLSWYLERVPEAASVSGKKEMERGLIHRLDTPTEGLVLIAKTQETYDFFKEAQEGDSILKRYTALCDRMGGELPENLPYEIISRFRAWGPKGREVRPVFPGDRRFEEAGRDYRTLLESAESAASGRILCVCTLTRGYRHQVRAHLASQGFPIHGDPLYNPAPGGKVLMLSATGLEFPDPDSPSGAIKSFSLR